MIIPTHESSYRRRLSVSVRIHQIEMGRSGLSFFANDSKENNRMDFVILFPKLELEQRTEPNNSNKWSK